MNSLILESIRIAFSALKRNTTRTVLSILGTAIGITAIVVIMSAGSSLQAIVGDMMNMFGTNFIEIEIKVPNTSQTSTDNAAGIVQGISITTLSLEDKEDVDKLENIKGSYGAVIGQATASSQYKEKRFNYYGVSQEFEWIDTGDIGEGRFYSKEEEDGLARVVVLGSDAAKILFPNQSALGQSIKIQKQKFKIIGIYKERGGAVPFFNMDEMLFIPLKTAHKRLLGFDHLMAIIAQAEDMEIASDTAKEMTYIVRENHDITDPNKDDFAVITQDEAAELVNVLINGITWVLGIIASIALVVGGVGIMNIMYVAVSERVFEIGLRKAVGASGIRIRFQFLIEAIVITLFGGIAGIILAFVFILLVYLAANYKGFDWPFAFSYSAVILAISFSSLVGLFFGYFPAKKASLLRPIDALRSKGS